MILEKAPFGVKPEPAIDFASRVHERFCHFSLDRIAASRHAMTSK
tara:strand:- start:651 stop:785 length:135 start_codon:yes stop_codon:yes gene_type:complete